MTHPFRDRAAIVGVGYTPFSKASGKTTMTLAIDAVSAALADAGLESSQVDGYSTYAVRNDSVWPAELAQAFGNLENLRYYVNQSGGGSLSHTVVAEAAMACTLGLADYVVCYRALNGRSGYRMGGHGRPAAAGGEEQFMVTQGCTAPVQRYAMAARAHMLKYGTTPEQLASVSVNQRAYAVLNERAMLRTPITYDDYFESRMIADPLHLYDCCLETDAACAVVVTSAERARDLVRQPVYISGAVWGPGHLVASGSWPDITETGAKYSAPRLYEQAGIRPEDIDVAEIYDCFSPTVLMQLEDYGFCEKGDGGAFVASGATGLGGHLPVNTHGGFLGEGYVHGMNTLCEAVLQVRGDCGERQVPNARVALSTGGDGLVVGHTSALVVRS